MSKKCPLGKCDGTGKIKYYYNAGDHFSANPSSDSGWTIRECDCKKKNPYDELFKKKIKK